MSFCTKRDCKRLLVTGGAGFIGSSFIHFLLTRKEVERVINLDHLTYAASLENVRSCAEDARYRFVCGNILDQALIETLIEEEKIDAIVHFAAETHVDRSIVSAYPFVQTNVLGTLSLLEAVRKKPFVHFHHISTDEVFGMLAKEGFFSETSSYAPNSPYSASKAGADHLVRAFAHTYKLSTTLTHSSNNYGPGQYPEKLIPLVIRNCLEQKPVPIYGEGQNVRDWLYVEDHAEAIWQILLYGKRGESYGIGGGCELSNLDLVHRVIALVAELTEKPKEGFQKLICFVPDRPGHDFRYALDTTKIAQEMGWKAKTSLHQGLKKTIEHYLLWVTTLPA